MVFHRFYEDSIAQASYLVGCLATGEAAIIDPNRDLEQYMEMASQKGLRIVAVTETHIHADYVSGSRELAAVTGATLYLSKEGGQDWQYGFADEPNVRLIGDGDEIRIGNVRLVARHTPGHTPEHLSFLVIDGAATDQPIGVLTGDFIFAGDVGRPDLLEVAAGVQNTMRAGAESLFISISKFKDMPDWLTLWPGHGAGSACGKRLGGVPSTTLGYEKVVNPSFAFGDQASFVEDILSGQPEPPKYFARMKRVNKIGPEPTRGRWEIGEVGEVQGSQLLDVRSGEEILRGTERGAIAVPFTASFSKWAGSLLDADQPVVILAQNEAQARAAAKALVLIGIEKLAGWRVPRTDTIVRTTQRIPHDGKTIVDLRSSAERAEEGFLVGASHVPLAYLADHAGDFCGQVYLHCASGGRSLIAASYLARCGVDAVAVMADFEDLKKETEGALTSR
jgi:hydroxyacylglutathione hydrolase